MKVVSAIKVGFSFGLASGVITTLGMIMGLSAGTNSKLAVLGGIVTIAVADAFSDSLGIHISQESENEHSSQEIWTATAATFAAKFLVAFSFVLPVLLLPLSQAVIAAIIWGAVLLGIFSYMLALKEKKSSVSVIGEHLFIAIIVLVVTNLVGRFVVSNFH